MIAVVDTSVLIDHLRGDARAIDALRSVTRSGDELWSVTPVRTEILAGARSAELDPIRALFDQMRWLDVSPSLADDAGELARRFLRSDPGVDTVDYLIAAGVQDLEARLLTLNVRHFPMFEDLQPAYR